MVATTCREYSSALFGIEHIANEVLNKVANLLAKSDADAAGRRARSDGCCPRNAICGIHRLVQRPGTTGRHSDIGAVAVNNGSPVVVGLRKRGASQGPSDAI